MLQRFLFCLLWCSLLLGTTLAQTAESKESKAVRTVLDAQVAAWNQGDIRGFMEGYWRSEKTVFVSGDTVTIGWQTVLDRYLRSYDTRDKMGTLSFTDLSLQPLDKKTFIVVGRWALTRATDEPHGRFTLIFRKFKEGWRIIHDHTSSA